MPIKPFYKKCLPILLFVLNGCVVPSMQTGADAVLLHAARVFDGDTFKTNTSVLVENGKIARIDSRGTFRSGFAQEIDLGDATLLPGFIELHAHLDFQHIPADTVLKHGITTIRDVGGPLHQPYGGDGSLRVLTSGPIITAPGGYPILQLGSENIAIAVASETQGREVVRNLINGGAVVIKVALEAGGEAGAPWVSEHHAGATHEHLHRGTLAAEQPWPLLPLNIVRAIVDEAHNQGLKVTAHIGEATAAKLALDAGIDEWAHLPCATIPEVLLKKAVAQNIKVVTTMDALSKCPGIAANARTLAVLGGELLYGAEIAHADIPWGIDAQELISMMRTTGMPLRPCVAQRLKRAGICIVRCWAR